VGAGVPAGAAGVVFDVTLKSFVKAKEKWEMNNQEKVRQFLDIGIMSNKHVTAGAGRVVLVCLLKSFVKAKEKWVMNNYEQVTYKCIGGWPQRFAAMECSAA
jgi:hypothetical protein